MRPVGRRLPVHDYGRARSGCTRALLRQDGRSLPAHHGGMDLSGRMVEVVLPPEALRILGKDFGFKIRLPKIAATQGRLPDSHFG